MQEKNIQFIPAPIRHDLYITSQNSNILIYLSPLYLIFFDIMIIYKKLRSRLNKQPAPELGGDSVVIFVV
jgi:hypothetical protein